MIQLFVTALRIFQKKNIAPIYVLAQISLVSLGMQDTIEADFGSFLDSQGNRPMKQIISVLSVYKHEQ